MEFGSDGLNWDLVIGELLGGALVVAAAYGLWLWRERGKQKRNERPPQPEKISRPAGYSASCMVDDLADRCVLAIIQGLGAGVVFGAVAGSLWPVVAGLALGRFKVRALIGAPRSDAILVGVLLAIVALLFAAHGLQRFSKLSKQMRDYRFGLRGEQAVAEKLASRELAAAGYTVFHDIPAQRSNAKWNLDHVVVGPQGVFVLETKARPRRDAKWDQKDNEVIYDGKVLKFPWCWDDEAVPQAQRNAEWLRAELGVHAPDGLMIQPVVVVPGWFVPPTIGRYDVKVMNADYLVGYLRGEKKIYTPEQMAHAIKWLEDTCRTLEF